MKALPAVFWNAMKVEEPSSRVMIAPTTPVESSWVIIR